MKNRSIIVCVGLQSSGKSTWAKQYLIDNPNSFRVNKDELRNMLWGEREWTQEQEGVVNNVQYSIVRTLISRDEDITIIIDDLNLNPKVFSKWQKLAESIKVQFIVQDFTDVPLEECIKRDSLRIGKAKIGEKVIRDTFYKYIKNNDNKQPKF